LSFADSDLNKPIFYFVITLIISIINGIFRGTISNPLMAWFYLIKISEYFIVFFLVYFYTRDRKDVIFYLTAALIGLISIGIYGIFEHFHPLAKLPYPALYRIYERGFFYGQSNHLGGMLAFFISLILGFIVFNDNWRNKILFLCLNFAVIFAFFWTYSRQAQLNLFISLSIFGILSLRYVNLRSRLIYFLIISVITLIVFSSPLLQERISTIKGAILSNDIYGSSFAYRLNKWKMAFADSKDYLLLGTGLASRHRAFYESQWVMFIAETGLIGVSIYLWFLFKVYKLLFLSFTNIRDSLCSGLISGSIAGLTGLVVQGFVCNVFTVTVIAAPFYVMLAIILGSTRKLSNHGKIT